MAVKIRLKRKGRKKLAFYDIVIANEKSPRDGRFIKKIGIYNPNTNPSSVNIDKNLALKWLLNGAQPTHIVKKIFLNLGIFFKKHLNMKLNKNLISKEDFDKKNINWKNKKNKFKEIKFKK